MMDGLAFANDISQEAVIPVPVGGLNLNDSLPNMPPLDAYQMDNVFPGASFISVRGGYAEHVTGVGSGNVSTLVQYSAGTVSQLIAAGGGKIYNATTASGTGVPVGTGYTNDVWDTILMRGTLLMFNGADTPQQYNGTSAGTASYTSATTATLTPANLIKVTQYRNRLYLTEKGFLGFWYGNVDAKTGALTQIDLTGVFQNGGYTMWCSRFTRDAGDGQDDLFVVASSNNEMLVYEGAYPDDPSWNKIGLYQIPTLLGRNSYINIGSDLLLLTSAGILPLSTVMQMGTIVNNNQKLSNKINQAFPALAKTYGSNDGWQMKVYPRGQYMLVNVPISPGQTYWQYVVNLQNGAWCRFLDQNGPSWTIKGDDLYFGGVDGRVFKADTGNNDDGDAINFEYRQAYNKFNYDSNKLFNMIQPNITAGGSFTVDVDVDVDFVNSPFANQISPSSGDESAWDTSPWDTTPWAGDFTIVDWYGLGAYGVYGSIRMRGNVSNSTLNFNSNKILFEPGGKI